MRSTLLLVTLALATVPALAHAQDEQVPEPPPPAVVTAFPNTQRPVYVAPLSQTTQFTYVPQSVALSGPRILSDWEEGQPIPDGYHQETRRRGGLIAGGSVLFAVPFFFSVLAAAIGADQDGQHNQLGSLYVPIFGPFIQMGSTTSATANLFLIMDGLTQTCGMAMFIAGIVAPKKVLVRNDLGVVSIAPLLGPGGAGMALHASF